MTVYSVEPGASRTQRDTSAFKTRMLRPALAVTVLHRAEGRFGRGRFRRGDLQPRVGRAESRLALGERHAHMPLRLQQSGDSWVRLHLQERHGARHADEGLPPDLPITASAMRKA